MKHHATYYLALEKYLLDRTDGEYFFTWDIYPTIVCGRHQLLQNEVNQEYLRSIGVELTRRHSGGGTVFADEGDFMFTFILRDHSEDLFARTLNYFISTLRPLGINAELTGRNDITFQGKKFSGNAFYKNEHGTIVHGTMMYDVNVERMVRGLNPDNEKLISKGIDSVRQRVINLKPYLNGMTREQLMAHFEQSIGMPVPELSAAARAEIDATERYYRSDEWLWGNNPAFEYSDKKHFSWGSAELRLQAKGNRIVKAALYGDFFPEHPVEELCSQLVDRQLNDNPLHDIDVSHYIAGATNADLLELFPK